MKIALSCLILIMLYVGTRIKSKDFRKLIRIAVCVGFAVLIANSVNNADYQVYERNYNQQTGFFESTFEMGYAALGYLFKLAGASYTGFNFIVSLIALLLIESTVAKYCRAPEWVMVMYFVYPLAMDATQYRNFLCMAILIFAIRYLVERKQYWWLKYYIFVAVAVTFHNIAVIAAVVPIAMVFRSHYAVVLPGVLIAGIAFVYSPLFQPTIRWIADNIFQKTYDYFDVRPDWGLLIPIGLQMGITFLVCYRQLALKVRYPVLLPYSSTSLRSVRSPYDRFDAMMLPYFKAALVFIVLYSMSSHFFRAFRSIYILGYMVIVNNFCLMEKKNRRFYSVLAVFMLAITWIGEINHLMDLVFIPFFT